MSILTKAQFSRLCKVQRTSISRAVARNDVIVDQLGNVDTDNLINQDYMRTVLEKREYREMEYNYIPIRLLNEDQEDIKEDNNDSFEFSNETIKVLNNIISLCKKHIKNLGGVNK